MEKKQSIHFINIARALLIILVVMGHSILGEMEKNLTIGSLYHTIWSFHMAAFFVISGYLFSLNYEKYIGGGISSSLRVSFVI